MWYVKNCKPKISTLDTELSAAATNSEVQTTLSSTELKSTLVLKLSRIMVLFFMLF